jgi:hypothetical protein
MRSKCSITGCDNWSGGESRRGLCQKHYAQGLRDGSLKRLHIPDRGCLVDGCTNRHEANGYCGFHGNRFRRYGDPLTEPKIADDGAPRVFMEEALKYVGDDCLFWPFSHEAQLNMIEENGKRRPHKVPRLICEATHGKPPTTKHEAAHECGNGHLGCVNPKHLTWKTHVENMRDMIAHGTSTKDKPNKSARKLSNEQVAEIRASKVPGRKLAKSYNVGKTTIGSIRQGLYYKETLR